MINSDSSCQNVWTFSWTGMGVNHIVKHMVRHLVKHMLKLHWSIWWSSFFHFPHYVVSGNNRLSAGLQKLRETGIVENGLHAADFRPRYEKANGQNSNGNFKVLVLKIHCFVVSALCCPRCLWFAFVICSLCCLHRLGFSLSVYIRQMSTMQAW